MSASGLVLLSIASKAGYPPRPKKLMRYRTAAPVSLLIVLPLLVGCETSAKDRLQGRWVGERVENFAPSQVARATGWARGASFEFRGNRVTVSIPAERPRQGTYQITHAAAEEMKLSFVRPHGARDEVALQFDGDGVIRWMLGGGRSVVLRKVVD